MTDRQLAQLKKSFSEYLSEFGAGTGDLHRFLQLKLTHSEHVADEARGLSTDLRWTVSEQNNAETMGLLHDTGRFQQFVKHHTFSDAASIDHGELGWRIVRKEGFLAGLPYDEQRPILDGVRYHNNRFIPSPLLPRSVRYVQLVRDADKLDIYRIVLDALDHDGFQDIREMLPDIRLDRSVSDAFADQARQGKAGDLSQVQSLGDFLLLQMRWIYDLNYRVAVQKALDRKILPRLANHIKDHPEVTRILEETEKKNGRQTHNEQ